MINKCIYQFLEKIHKPSQSNKDDSKETQIDLSLFLPYLGLPSLRLKRQIIKCIKDNIPNCNLRVVFSSKRRLSNFFKFKDKIPNDLQSHLIYKIQCAECNLCYYGLAERHYKVRAYDHLGLSIYTNKPIIGVPTAMKTHWRKSKHHITMDSISVLTREEKSFHLRIKESLLIKRDKPILNNNLYSTPLYLF